MDEADVIRVREAAELLQVSVPGLYELVRQKKVPAFHCGRSVRFSRRLLEEFKAGRQPVA